MGPNRIDTVDPVLAAASVITALQSVVSRNVDPQEMAVVTVGSIHGGSASNVIPESVEMKLTMRAYQREQSASSCGSAFRRWRGAQAESFGAAAEVDYRLGFPGARSTTASETDLRATVSRSTLSARRGSSEAIQAAHRQRGFRLHAAGKARQLPLRRQWRQRATAQRPLRFQRRDHRARRRATGYGSQKPISTEDSTGSGAGSHNERYVSSTPRPLDPRAKPLIDELTYEYDSRYGDYFSARAPRAEMNRYPAEAFAPPHGNSSCFCANGETIGGGAFKHYDEHTAELKRIWTRTRSAPPGACAQGDRTNSKSRPLRQGYSRIYLTTGFRQPEAVGLYLQHTATRRSSISRPIPEIYKNCHSKSTSASAATRRLARRSHRRTAASAAPPSHTSEARA